eukprot:499522-Rhodomonas_salina.1
MKLPTVFVQAPFAWQLCENGAVHSFLSEQSNPFPTYPVLHAQVKLPTVFVQSALLVQSSVSRAHSSASLHDTPSPLYPAPQEQVKLPAVLKQLALPEWQLCASLQHSFTSAQPTLPAAFEFVENPDLHSSQTEILEGEHNVHPGLQLGTAAQGRQVPLSLTALSDRRANEVRLSTPALTSASKSRKLSVSSQPKRATILSALLSSSPEMLKITLRVVEDDRLVRE